MELIVLLVSAAILQSTFAYEMDGVAGYKTYFDAEKEVAAFLHISDPKLDEIFNTGYPFETGITDNLVYFTLRNLRAWDVRTNVVIDNVLSQFFLENPDDPQFEQKTQDCLTEKVDSLDIFASTLRAYESFKCYLVNSGGINREEGWVPYTESEVITMLQVCMTALTTTSEDNLLQFCQGQYATNPAYPDVGYCFFVGAGFYTKCTGFDLVKFYIQFGETAIQSDATEACLAQTAGLYCREPERFLRGFLDCLVQFTPAVSVIGTAASKVLGNPPECVYPED